MEIMKGAEEYFLPGTNGKAVLLVHGYTGTPAEMRPLGDYLQHRGYNVFAVRLPGHGTDIEDLRRTRAEEWYAAAAAACRRLLAEYPQVYVAGLSMGGLLTLRLGVELPVQAIAVLAAPIEVLDKRAPFLPVLKHFIKTVPKKKKSYREMDRYNLAYSEMPTAPLTSLFNMINQVRKEGLPRLKVPCIVLQSKREHTVRPISAQYIYDHISSSKRQLVWFQHSGHILTLDHERQQVFEAVEKFFAAVEVNK